MKRKNELKALLFIGLIMSVVLIGMVFVAGQTFGQRCSDVYETNSEEWENCVNQLSAGDGIQNGISDHFSE